MRSTQLINWRIALGFLDIVQIELQEGGVEQNIVLQLHNNFNVVITFQIFYGKVSNVICYCHSLKYIYTVTVLISEGKGKNSLLFWSIEKINMMS